MGAVRRMDGSRAIEDHKLWAYFAHRFRVELVATLEPFPGIAPTSRHLASVVETAKAQRASMILLSPYFDPRSARWVEERSDLRVVKLAHQVGAREGTDDYVATIGYNVRQIVNAP